MTSRTLPLRLPGGSERVRVLKPRKYGQTVAAVIVAVVAAALVVAVAGNDHLDYSVITQYLTATTVLKGLLVTFELSILGMTLGVVLGLVVALARMSANRLLSAIAQFYIWLFRGVPLLVQLLIWGNLALLFPVLSLQIPFTTVSFLSVNTNAAITGFTAAVLGLGLNEAAYMAEVFRGGLISVDRGQQEAALALGMTDRLLMRRVVLPQAMRAIVPPTANQFISLIKASSLVSVIAGGDLLNAVQNIAAVNLRTIELLLVASIWYLVIVTILTVCQYFLERRVSRGYR